MSGKELWRNAIIIFAILIGTALVTAVWPLLTPPRGDGIGRLPPETTTIELNPPAMSLPGLGSVGGPIELSGFAAVGILAVIIIGGVVVTGGILAALYVLLSRQAALIEESDEFKASQAVLEKREKEKIQRLRADRTTAAAPQHKMPRWSAISTSLIVLLFVVFFALILNAAFVPSGEIVWRPPWSNSEQIINSAWLFVGGLVLLALPFLFWYVRGQRLETVEATDNSGIPWDFIAVLLTGLLVVGLGLSIMVYLNAPV